MGVGAMRLLHSAAALGCLIRYEWADELSEQGESRTRFLMMARVVAIALAAAAAAIAWQWWSDTDMAAAKRVATALEQQDWGRVYDLSSPGEQRASPFSRGQFVEIMSFLFGKAPRNRVKSGTFHVYRDARNGRIRVKASWRDPQDTKDRDNGRRTCEVSIVRYEGRWYSLMAGLISCGARVATDDPRDGARLLLEGMRRHGITQVISGLGWVMTPSSLEDYIENYPSGSPERPWTRADVRRR